MRGAWGQMASSEFVTTRDRWSAPPKYSAMEPPSSQSLFEALSALHRNQTPLPSFRKFLRVICNLTVAHATVSVFRG